MYPPFELVPVAINLDRRLTFNDLRVLLALYAYADEEGHCWPKRATLSRLTGLRKKEISLRTTRLVEFGWLRKEGKGGYSKSNHYYLQIPRHLRQAVLNSGTVHETSTVQSLATVRDPQKNGTGNRYKTVRKPGSRKEQTMNMKELGGDPEPAIAIDELENMFPETDVKCELSKLVIKKGPIALQSREEILRWLEAHELFRKRRDFTGIPEPGSKLDREQKRKEEQMRKKAAAIQDAEIAGRDFGRQNDRFDREEAIRAADERGIPNQYLEHFLLVAEGASEKPKLALAPYSRVRNGQTD